MNASQSSNSKIISIVAPAFNEEKVIEAFYTEIVEVFQSLDYDFELVIVENGSTDQSLEILKNLNKNDPRVHFLSLSRNYGHQGAIIAGFDYCSGGAVISMDADLQHPPELIPDLIRLWEEGNDIVYTIKREPKSALGIRKFFDHIFYELLNSLSGYDLHGQSDFRLMDRKVIDVIKKLPERNKFLRGLVKWVGFKQSGVEYDVQKRADGVSKFNVAQLSKLAIDGILSFSIIPLRLFTLLGFTISGTVLLYGLYLAVIKFYALVTGIDIAYLPPGWATLACVILFFGGIQLIGIGLLGEYLGRVYDEVKGRPIYIVKESSLAEITNE